MEQNYTKLPLSFRFNSEWSSLGFSWFQIWIYWKHENLYLGCSSKIFIFQESLRTSFSFSGFNTVFLNSLMRTDRSLSFLECSFSKKSNKGMSKQFLILFRQYLIRFCREYNFSWAFAYRVLEFSTLISS